MTEDVFKVVYECRNCGKEFSETYPEKTKVEYDGLQVVVRDTEAPIGKGIEFVGCPNCKLEKSVKIKNRKPIGGQKKDD